MIEIFIYDDIGPDWLGMVSARGVINDLAKAGSGTAVTVRINSPGGDVVEAQAIYNALRRHSWDGGRVVVEIDALAASAASFLAMAGDEIRMAENSMMMIHQAWTVSMGNAQQLRDTADVLDKFDGILTNTYAARSGQNSEKISGMLAAETWLTAEEALESGLADTISQPLNVAAHVGKGRYAKTPSRFMQERSFDSELNELRDLGFVRMRDDGKLELTASGRDQAQLVRNKIRLTRVR